MLWYRNILKVLHSYAAVHKMLLVALFYKDTSLALHTQLLSVLKCYFIQLITWFIFQFFLAKLIKKSEKNSDTRWIAEYKITKFFCSCSSCHTGELCHPLSCTEAVLMPYYCYLSIFKVSHGLELLTKNEWKCAWFSCPNNTMNRYY